MPSLASHYAVNQGNDTSVWCGAVPNLRRSGGYSYPAGPISSIYTLAADGSPDTASSQYFPIKLSVIQYPAQLIGVVELNQKNGTVSSAEPLYQNIASEKAPRGLFAGHLATSNYLFMDGHVKALKPEATAEPYDMWDMNKQDQSCPQMITAAAGLGNVSAYYANGVRN